ncbi:hypothetical protein [Falsiruegeria mediterranea]|nr:hypothetical protein [Falsiruegeria mediterranea]
MDRLDHERAKTGKLNTFSTTTTPASNRAMLSSITFNAGIMALGTAWGGGVLIESAGPRATSPTRRIATGVVHQQEGRLIQVNSMGAAIQLAKQNTGVALAALPFVAEALKAGALVDAGPGNSLEGKNHGFTLRQIESVRPIVKRVAYWLIEKSDKH